MVEKRDDWRLSYPFSYLSDRELDILMLNYGMAEGWEEITLSEIGYIYGFTRERARQIRNDAVKEIGKRSKRIANRLVALRPDGRQPSIMNPRNRTEIRVEVQRLLAEASLLE